MKPLLILGSTGSIGTQTLDVVRASSGHFKVMGLVAGSSWEELLAQVLEFRPVLVGLSDPEAAEALSTKLPACTRLISGPDAPERVCRELDYELCVHGMVGARGLSPSVVVIERGKQLALANKESLVVGGELLMQLAREHGGSIIPVDSEHSAIFQCLAGEDIGRVRRILLTASGGPFRGGQPADLESVTPAMALKHPTWVMGPRVTIGSATLMNKALEVIEVHHLFGLERERIEVVIHPQSIVHSMVEFVDGSVLGQMGPPDMRGPIHYAMYYPERAPSNLKGFDLDLFRNLSFDRPDPDLYPSLELGFRCVEEGSDSGSVLNAADEIAVQAFLEERIRFLDIHTINRTTLDARPGLDRDFKSLLEADSRARELARENVSSLGSSRSA